MPDRIERLKKFIDVINQDELGRRAHTQAQIEADCKRDFSTAQTETKQKYKRIVEGRAARQLEDMNRAIYEETAATRKRLSEKREQITSSVFSLAEKEITAFTKTNEYKTFMIKSAESLGELYNRYEVTIFVKPSDIGLSDELKAAFGGNCTISADSSVKLGGLKAVCASQNIKADDTLDTRLSSQREQFRLISGLSVMPVAEVNENV